MRDHARRLAPVPDGGLEGAPDRGVVVPVAGSPFAAGDGPIALLSSPTTSNRYLYVANNGSGDVTGFSYDSTGALAPLAGSPFAAGSAPTDLALLGELPSLGTDHLIAVADALGELRMFTFDLGGALTAVPGAPIASGGGGPVEIQADTLTTCVADQLHEQ